MSEEIKIRAVQLIRQKLGLEGPFHVELLPKGYSGSEVIRVGDLVVRFWNMQWEDYFSQDLACQLVASDAGYGPKVYFSDEATGITIMQYHRPEPLPNTPERFKQLARLLKTIHLGPSVPKGIDRKIYLDQLIEETKGMGYFDPEAICSIKDTVFGVTRRGACLLTCHRDLHHGNLLYSKGTFSVIDFTWTAIDDPFTDLANIALFNCQTEEEERLLLEQYLGHQPNAKEIARLSLMKLPVKLFYALEFLGIAGLELETGACGKSYRDFGHHGGEAPSKADLLYNAKTLLNEVTSYFHSKSCLEAIKLMDSAF